MGGALAQWYLKYVGDHLPAAVLVAPWVSHSAFQDGFVRFLRLDPLGCLLMMLDWTSTPLIRTPQRAARALISERAVCSPEALHAKLTPESALILYQHNPPFWSPAEHVKTPMLWLAGEKDTLIGQAAERRSAAGNRLPAMAAGLAVAVRRGEAWIVGRSARLPCRRATRARIPDSSIGRASGC